MTKHPPDLTGSLSDPAFVDEREKGNLTVGKVDVFGDLVPGAVVKMADLLFVLHHVGRLSPLFVLHCNVVLDCLEILPVLQDRKSDDEYKMEIICGIRKVLFVQVLTS